MRHSKTGRIIGITASACLLFALSCSLLGLGVQQRVITLKDINVGLGPLSITMQAPRPSVCPLAERGDPLTNLCERFSSVKGSPAYRLLLFWSAPERGQQSTRVLTSWTLPVHDEARN
jgi:hypothetical protein